jgi:hypothetical protein
MQADIISNPKSFWNFINIKKKSDGYPSALKYIDQSSNDPKIISNLFAKYFSRAFSVTNPEPDGDYFKYMNDYPQISLASININYDTVIDKINKLKDDYSYGPDGLPAIVLKKCISTLSQPLTVLFQKSLASAIFPSIWKDSFSNPIYKKGSKSEVSNYRPIAKLSCIPNLFESIVYDALYFHCKPLFSSR